MRNLTPEIAAEFASKHVEPIFLAEMFFDSGVLRMWTGVGDLEYNGNTFTGGGNLVSISAIEENQNIEAKGITCGINGIPSNLIALALQERSRGGPFRLYLSYILESVSEGFLDLEDGTGQITQEDDFLIELEANAIFNPYRIFTGIMDVINIVDNGDTALINLSVENSMLIGQREKVGRYTAEDQKRRYPGDKGLDFINRLQDKQIVW